MDLDCIKKYTKTMNYIKNKINEKGLEGGI